MMTLEDELRDIIEQMKTKRIVTVEFETGLSDVEINHVEEQCDFRFPPDLRTFLQIALPTGSKNINGIEQFPNWRKNPVEIMQRNTGIWQDDFCHDVEHRNVWITEFGEKPETLAEQLAVVRAYLKNVSTMIPIYGHRMIPAQPCEAGNPVFSIVQLNDTVHYGYNLQNYLRNEFLPWEMNWGEASDYLYIPFWSKIASGVVP
ncbi:MAG: hypothetical protein H0X30_00500 [Anaerolineae bacterium]|nr:hypothetical protein [Anaerolineae bacterium]